MSKKRTSLCLLIILFTVMLCNTGSAGVTPEILLGARGISSLNLDYSPGGDSETVSDISDTSLLVGFRQKLYNRYRGALVIGFQFPDEGSDLEPILFHQVFLRVEDRTNIFRIGRTRVRSAMIEFPTLRDDDAIYFTDILNPFSSGEDAEDNQYGSIMEATRIFGQRYQLSAYGEHLKEETENISKDFGFNALGLSFQYRVPESQRWNREILNQIGISLNTALTSRPGYSGELDKALKSITFSTVLNIRPDPVHFWDLRHQSIFNLGFSEVKNLSDYSDITRARSISTFTSLRYLYRKLERPALQAALSYGYKAFPDLSNNSSQHQVIANSFYRIGENFDVGLQLRYQKNSGDLKTIIGEHETEVQFAFIYSIEQLWNSQFDDRESLLNLEHGYIP
ncbi:MAG: hypothetical protein GXO95_06290 [Nitrospirae bacterium]|nr:hypothetical protein [Nitrospirota bacterium]